MTRRPRLGRGIARRCRRAAVLLLAAACAPPVRDDGATAVPAVAITDVTVVDVARGALQPGRTVLVVGDRVEQVGATGAVHLPPGTRRVRGTGRYLIPGLWDVHTHVAMTGRASLGVFLASGVTGVRDMGTRPAVVRAWRDSIRAGRLAGPRVLMAGPIVESARWLDFYRRTRLAAGDSTPAGLLADRIGVETPEDARRAVDSAVALGADLVKVRNWPGPEATQALLAAAGAHGLPVAAHAPFDLPPERLPLLGIASLEHGMLGFVHGRVASPLEGVEGEARAALLARLAAAGTVWVPTLVATASARLVPDSAILAAIAAPPSDPRRCPVPALAAKWRTDVAQRAAESPLDWEALQRSWVREVGDLHAAGVRILAGSDAGAPLTFAGAGLHDELALLVRAGGLTPLDALRAATLTPARFLGLPAPAGTVAPGAPADLVLLDADPLADIANAARVHAVIAAGTLHDRAALDALLAAAGRACRA